MNGNRPNIVIVGSMNVDFTVTSSKIPAEGESFIGESFRVGFGGKGACQAIAAARMGANVSMIGCVGSDAFAMQMLDVLIKEGIHTEQVRRITSHATGAAFILLETDGHNRIISVPGANRMLAAEDVQAAGPLISQADMLVLQLETSMEAVVAATDLAKSFGVPVLLNPGPTPEIALPDKLLAKVHCLTPNEVEAEALTGMAIQDIADAEHAAKRLAEKGVRHVAITMGERGSYIWEGGKGEWIPPFLVRSVDSVGAGDTFTGALAVELLHGSTFKSAVEFANRAAAISVTRKGAIDAIPSRQEVINFSFDKRRSI